MRILDRYLLRAYLAPLIWCLSIFSGLYLVLDLLEHLDDILYNHVAFSIVTKYYLLMLPMIFVQVAPFACLMATLYTLSTLNKYLEIMAMRAAGIRPWSITRPFIWVAILVSIGVFAMNEWVVPQANVVTHQIRQVKLERISAVKKAKYRSPHVVENLTAFGLGHSLMYAKTFDPVEKRLEGVIVLQHGSDLHLLRKITAESGVWTADSYWRFYNGTILHFNTDGQAIGRAAPFTVKIIRVGDKPEYLERAENQSSLLNMRDLNRYIRRLQGAGNATLRKLRVDLYGKPAAAAVCLVLTILGVPFAIQPVRGGAALGLSLGIGVGLVFYGANALCVALGKGGWLPPLMAAWVAPIGFTWFGLRETWKKLA